jgi:hypothetical protein
MLHRLHVLARAARRAIAARLRRSGDDGSIRRSPPNRQW